MPSAEFTVEEIAEIQIIVRRVFKGRGRPGDDERCNELWNKNPQAYAKLASEVRQDVREKMRRYF